MTNYWDNEKSYQERGIDWNLSGCLEFNPQPFNLDDIAKVLAVYEGERDADDWRWVLKLNRAAAKVHGHAFVFLQGGCDYTGWDCQSWAKCAFADTARKAAEYAKGGPPGVTVQDAITSMGLGRMISALQGEYMSNSGEVYKSLIQQLRSRKNKTWREKKDDEFRNDLPKIGK